MISELLLLLPSWVTGRIGPKARSEVKGWRKNNATLKMFKYGSIQRILMWGAGRPVMFAVSVGVFTSFFAYVIAGQQWAFVPHLSSPKVDSHFDLATYAGLPWGVQATLVALVYPIVLSFIALMLQRRSHSVVALHVYILDSGVIPAGASSIGLLVVMGAQYFATPYSTLGFLEEYFAALLIFNGTWFVGNLFLTGLFLARTISFIQEGAQRFAYTRLAVNVVLKEELTSAVMQHMYVNAPPKVWYLAKEDPSISQTKPQVRMWSFGTERPAVVWKVKGNQVLHDVHLNLLKLIVWSWSKRVQQNSSNNGLSPIICFPPRIGESGTGSIVLCATENGPSLTFAERILVRFAFCYKSTKNLKLTLSTKMMLEEIGGEVESAAEQFRFGVADAGLRNVMQLHETLLKASAAENTGVLTNTATIGCAPYSLFDSSFDIEWLKPYRELGRIAVENIDEDLRLFTTLAYVPAKIAAVISTKPEKPIVDAMMVGTNLMYQLGAWWTRKADASLVPGTASFNGTLPAPLSKLYEQAIVSFLGNWGHIYIRIPKHSSMDEADIWETYTARALIYAKHIEHSAELLLKAVSRGDEVASVWLLDSFIKWWGQRQHELKCMDSEEFSALNVTLSLADKPWDEAKKFLADGETPVTIERAGKAINLGIRRYWESMRLYIALLLIHNAGQNPKSDCREFRLASALIKGTSQKRGGNVECWPLDNIDALTTGFLKTAYGAESVVSRIDSFAENLRLVNEAPEVSGRIYGWSGSPNDFDSMKYPLATLLVALFITRGRNVGENLKLIESWWKEPDKLDTVARCCQDIRRHILSNEFRFLAPAVTLLQSYLGMVNPPKYNRLGVTLALKNLHRAAVFERLVTLRIFDVDESIVESLAEDIGTYTFCPQTFPTSNHTAIEYVPTLMADKCSITFEDQKIRYIAETPSPLSKDFAESLGKLLTNHIICSAFQIRVAKSGVLPVNTVSLRNNYDAAEIEAQFFLTSVGNLCSSLISAGEDPIVLVGQAAPSTYLRTYKWRPGFYQYQLPEGVSLHDSDPNAGESALAFINGAPVYHFPTPNSDCYVVPISLIRTLEVAGTDPASALSIKWSHVTDERLRFELSWKARFS